MKTVDRRLAALEATGRGTAIVGVWHEPQEWDSEYNDGLVRVCGTNERVTLDEFAQRYPNGTLVRVVYTDDWHGQDGAQ